MRSRVGRATGGNCGLWERPPGRDGVATTPIHWPAALVVDPMALSQPQRGQEAAPTVRGRPNRQTRERISPVLTLTRQAGSVRWNEAAANRLWRRGRR